MKRLHSLASRILLMAYFVLVFITPLLVIPYTSELFEFNKMFAVYAITIVVLTSWLIKGISGGKLKVSRSPLDIPIALFLLALSISYFVSIDPHVSIWGYYSRQHGGLLSVISFILLYYGFLSNVSKETTIKLLKLSVVSGLLVALYGVLQHFGIDKHLWVQDVARRVFSTLGQPNWLAAYMNIMLFISLGLGQDYLKGKNFRTLFNRIMFVYILPSVFFLAILYTKSRSGLLGFVIADAVFWLMFFKKQGIIKYRKLIISFHLILLALAFTAGLYGTPLHKFTAPSIVDKYKLSRIDETIISREEGTVLSRGGTESGEIRKLVWQAALNAAQANPLFGTGVETFAWAFYKYRPVEHNLTSEWDFLYNKAHNEYLNFLATTGYVGLSTYLLFLAVFIYAAVRTTLKSSHSLTIGLFSAWISILVTNFFGFSVVIISVFFWLIPASVFVLISHTGCVTVITHPVCDGVWVKRVLILITFLFGGTLLVILGRYWYADVLYAKGQDLINNGYSLEGRRKLTIAVKLRPNEPRYWSELAYANGRQAVSAYQREESSLAGALGDEAIAFQDISRSISPNNLNLAKDNVRLLYLLSETKPELQNLAILKLKLARDLSPNDPKLLYNLALLYSSDNKNSKLVIPTLKLAIELKSNYRDARILLALFYLQADEDELAKDQFEYVLENINSNDKEAADYLEAALQK